MTLEAEILDSITSVYRQHGGEWWDSTRDMLAAMAEAAAHAAEHYESTPVQAEDAITALRKTLDVTRIQLAGAVLAACPGPHRPVQHRDHKPAWCEACGYTAEGQLIKTSEEAA